MITVFIQARLGSKRFNSKILEQIQGKSVLQHVYRRVCNSKLVNNVYVIIPDNEYLLEMYCKAYEIKYLKGSPEDVLDRFYTCNIKINAGHIVRITCDCPCLDYKIIDDLIKKHLKEKNDYTSNNFFDLETYPDGLDCEIITRECLNELWSFAQGKHREHVTSYVRENTNLYKCSMLKNKLGNYSNLRLSLDYPEDLKLIKLVYSRLYEKNNFFGQKEIIELYKKEPKLFEINKMYIRNASYYEGK